MYGVGNKRKQFFMDFINSIDQQFYIFSLKIEYKSNGRTYRMSATVTLLPYLYIHM